MTSLRIGSRKSALAQAQARGIAEHLQRAFPDVTMELVYISTSGDRGAEGPTVNLKAMFTKEIEEALLENKIDLAVHSLKDMAGELPAGLDLVAVPFREDPRDVWISKGKVRFKDLARGATIATGAVRRQAQLKYFRPDLQIVSLRGNVDTRLKKLQDGDMDGMILALAGLKRLGLAKSVTETLSPEVMLPAIGQGALAIEARSKNPAIEIFVNSLNHTASFQAALAERAFLKALGGNCQTPIAAYATLSDTKLTLTGLVVSPSGNPYLKASQDGPAKDAEKIGSQLAKLLLDRGADRILS